MTRLNEVLTDAQIEATFYAVSDQLHACYETGEARLGLTLLEVMNECVKALDVPDQPTNIEPSMRIPGWRYVEESL